MQSFRVLKPGKVERGIDLADFGGVADFESWGRVVSLIRSSRDDSSLSGLKQVSKLD